MIVRVRKPIITRKFKNYKISVYALPYSFIITLLNTEKGEIEEIAYVKDPGEIELAIIRMLKEVRR